MNAEQNANNSMTTAGRLPSRILEQFRGIESTPGVCGGNARIAGTRIPVWTLEEWRQLGQTESEILANYPSLSAADLVTAWAYTNDHPDEIAEAIRLNNEEDSDESERDPSAVDARVSTRTVGRDRPSGGL